MRLHPFVLSLLVPFTLTAALVGSACLGNAPTPSNGGAGGSSSASGGGGAGGSGAGGAGGSGGPDGGPKAVCTIQNGADPVGLCTQKTVLSDEHKVAFKAMTGVAQSWDSFSLEPDVDPSGNVFHDPRDDAAYAAACARYHHSATVYGDTKLTATLDADLVALGSLLPTEITPTTGGYAGELYFDLRTAAVGLNTLPVPTTTVTTVDMLAETYGRAIHDTSYVALGSIVVDGGDGGGGMDGVLGTPAAGGGTAYAPADAATGAYALVDLAVRHAADAPASAATWQAAAASVLAHLDARARDPSTGLYYASLVTSADPDHDALAPAQAGGPPADALLTEVNARIALAYIRAGELATTNATAVPAIAALPLEKRAEALLSALDTTPQDGGAEAGGLWDTTVGGYFTGWVPSTKQILTDKPTRGNALVMAAIHDASVYSFYAPDPGRVATLRGLFTVATKNPIPSFINSILGQLGYFLSVPQTFAFAADAGTSGRQMSYFSSANTSAVEGLSELWVGIQP